MYVRKQIKSCEGAGGGWEEEMRKGQKETFERDRCVHYLYCIDGFHGNIHIKAIKLLTLNMCSLPYVN